METGEDILLTLKEIFLILQEYRVVLPNVDLDNEIKNLEEELDNYHDIRTTS